MSDTTTPQSLELLEASGSVLSYEHLSYEVGIKGRTKRLVDDVSVQVRAGELLAIMVYYHPKPHHSLA